MYWPLHSCVRDFFLKRPREWLNIAVTWAHSIMPCTVLLRPNISARYWMRAERKTISLVKSRRLLCIRFEFIFDFWLLKFSPGIHNYRRLTIAAAAFANALNSRMVLLGIFIIFLGPVDDIREVNLTVGRYDGSHQWSWSIARIIIWNDRHINQV